MAGIGQPDIQVFATTGFCKLLAFNDLNFSADTSALP
jgi:hypothetical protein